MPAGAGIVLVLVVVLVLGRLFGAKGLTRANALYRRVLYQGCFRVAQTIEDEDDDEDGHEDEKRALGHAFRGGERNPFWV
jgi:hypothetical protein